ncbi:MAG: DUF3108 domain-containing protein [bacterium]
MKSVIWIAAVVAVACCVGSASWAQSGSVLLEKGIYTEETAGDVDGAIKIYGQIISSAQSNEPYVAQACYRLGLCYLKKGDKTKATETLKILLSRFPDQKELAAKAQRELSRLGWQALPLNPAPWSDGEVMRFNLKTMAGMEVGTMIWSVGAEKSGGRDAWRIEQRLFVAANNTIQFTRVVAAQDTFAPISGLTGNQLGRFHADYSEEKVDLETESAGRKTTRQIPLDHVAYDNEQALYLIRRLPLAEGYRASFPIFPVTGGAVVECRIEVTGKEKLTVPAGTFECYMVELSIYQGNVKALQHRLSISTDSHRYLVQYDTGAAICELLGVDREPADPTHFQDKDLGISMTVPPGWYAYKDSSVSQYKLRLQLLPPELKTWASFAVAERTPDATSSRTVAERDVAVLKGYFKNYTVRPESWTGQVTGAMAPVSYVADYEENGKPLVEYRTYVLGKSAVYWFVFRIENDLFNANKADFDAIVDSLRLPEKDLGKAAELYRQTQKIKLSPNGSALHESEMVSVNDSEISMETRSFISSLMDIAEILDSEGNTLPFGVDQEDDHYRYTVQLLHPVAPGKEYTLKCVTKRDRAARKQGDLWVYETKHTPIPETIYTETVVLPPGAEPVQVEPDYAKRSEEGGLISLRFEKHLQENEAFQCRIKYRLAGGTVSQTEDKEADRLDSEKFTTLGQRAWVAGRDAKSPSVREEKLAEAEQLFEKAVGRNPTNIMAWISLGLVHMQQGTPLNARRDFEKALSLKPDNALALEGLGWVARTEGKREEAIALWKKTLEQTEMPVEIRGHFGTGDWEGMRCETMRGLSEAYLEAGAADEAKKYAGMWLATGMQTDRARNMIKRIEASGGQSSLRALFDKRMEQDRGYYTDRQLSEIEQLYQVSNKQWNSPEAKESLKQLLAKYNRANRTGCALLYMGQMSEGAEKETYLKKAIAEYGDCMYGDGVQVGAYARFLLAGYCKDIGESQDADKNLEEMRQNYPEAIDHSGNSLAEQLSAR